jgi:diacylglycerol kinase family enzyme
LNYSELVFNTQLVLKMAAYSAVPEVHSEVHNDYLQSVTPDTDEQKTVPLLPTSSDVERPEENKHFTPTSMEVLYNGLRYTLRLTKHALVYTPTPQFKRMRGGSIRMEDIIGITKSSRKGQMEQMNVHAAWHVAKGGCISPGSTATMHREVFMFECPNGLELEKFMFELDSVLHTNPLWKRPRSLAVIINPVGGHGKAKAEYEKRARPLFLLAGIRLMEILTERKQHVYEITEKLDLTQIDGIVSVGGDGMFFEIVNGLMKRPDKETAINTPLGLIPAGSQNALAVSCAGHVCAESHALDIIKGKRMPMDVVRVHHKKTDQYIYSNIITAFGFMGDVGNTSQDYRHLGPLRYLYCGALHLTRPKFYKIKLQYIPHDSPTNEWHHLEENIFSFMACNLSCANTQFPALCPQAHPTDGCLTLCVWKKCTRFQMFRFSSSHKSGTHHKLPFVKMLKVRALRFEPISEGSYLNIDGEIFESSELDFELQPSFLTLMCAPPIVL